MIKLKKTIGLGLIILAIGATSITVFASPVHKSPLGSVTENFRQTSSGIITEDNEMLYENNRNQGTCHNQSESEMHNGMNHNSHSNSRNRRYKNNSNN